MGDVRAHSIFAPSAAYRWTKCPGSIKLSKGCPDIQNKHTIEGTDAHWLGEQTMKTPYIRPWPTAKSFIGAQMPSRALVKRGMASHVQLYVDYVDKHFQALGGKLYVETRLEMPKIDPRFFGSADVIIVAANGTLHIFDLKYGIWPVEAEDNEQLMSYGLGALYKFKRFLDLTKPVTSHICGPRFAKTYNEQFKSAVFSIEKLTEFGHHLRRSINAADQPKPNLVDGDHCGFCPAEFICPKLNQFGRKIWGV